MARPVRRIPLQSGPAFVLDSQPFSLLADEHRPTMAMLEIARQEGFAPVISAVTIAEQRRTGKAAQRLAYQRSRVSVHPATEAIADLAAALLADTGLDGHECVVDALVVATAAAINGPVKLATSDGSHIPALCKAAANRRNGMPLDVVLV